MKTTGPRPTDATSPEALLLAVYEVLSGEQNESRDWPRFLALFAPSALIRPVRFPGNGRAEIDAFSPEEYAASRSPLLAVGPFYECEVAREEFRFGHLAHVLSHYESRRSPDGDAFASGVNSAQVFNDGSRWWILSVAWNTQ